MTFHFPYMHILNLKEKEKEQAYIELGTIVRKKEAVIENKSSLEQKRNEFLNQAASKGHTSIADIQQQHEYLNYLNGEMAKLEEKISQLDHEIAGKKSELLTRQKDEKTWVHLRAKSFEKYIQKQKKIEQDMMDEMAAISHFHQRLSM
jgi:flagellar protein FliJ